MCLVPHPPEQISTVEDEEQDPTTQIALMIRGFIIGLMKLDKHQIKDLDG